MSYSSHYAHPDAYAHDPHKRGATLPPSTRYPCYPPTSSWSTYQPSQSQQQPSSSSPLNRRPPMYDASYPPSPDPWYNAAPASYQTTSHRATTSSSAQFHYHPHHTSAPQARYHPSNAHHRDAHRDPHHVQWHDIPPPIDHDRSPYACIPLPPTTPDLRARPLEECYDEGEKSGEGTAATPALLNLPNLGPDMYPRREHVTNSNESHAQVHGPIYPSPSSSASATRYRTGHTQNNSREMMRGNTASAGFTSCDHLSVESAEHGHSYDSLGKRKSCLSRVDNNEATLESEPKARRWRRQPRNE